MGFSRRIADALITLIAAAFFSVLAADAVGSSYSGRLHSIAPADGYPGTVAVWVYFDYPISVDCSPPRACYAKSQWIYAYVACHLRSVAIMQQISMDLNGDVVAVVTSDVPQFISGMFISGPTDRVLNSVCRNIRDRD